VGDSSNCPPSAAWKKNPSLPIDSICESDTIKSNLINQTPQQETIAVARPPAKELTERELELMHVFWNTGQGTATEIRDRLAAAGRVLAYTTVATLIRILSDKGFVEQTNTERPFLYRPVRSFEDVSRNIVSDLVERVFRGSREQLVLRVLEDRPLSPEERAILEAAVHLMSKQEERAAEKEESAPQRQTKPPRKGEKNP
jgi:BlaI family transcriptional regulator, penicillinase repressor